MTVEERAKRLHSALRYVGTADPESERKELAAIESYLRDQIEECAKIVDQQARGFQILVDHAPTELRGVELRRVIHSLEVSANQIRALAPPKEEIPDGPDDSFDLWGFECNEKPID